MPVARKVKSKSIFQPSTKLSLDNGQPPSGRLTSTGLMHSFNQDRVGHCWLASGEARFWGKFFDLRNPSGFPPPRAVFRIFVMGKFRYTQRINTLRKSCRPFVCIRVTKA
jgi:hypothetical protein